MYVALDYETGGLEPGKSAPVTLGVALMENGEVIDSQEWIIGIVDKRSYDVRALEISGTSWTAIRKAPALTDVMGELAQWCHRHDAHELPVVAFNSSFDNAFYSDSLYLCGKFEGKYPNGVFVPMVPPLVGPWYCAMRMAQARLRLPNYKLDTVAGHFGLARSTGLHGSKEDAILAGKVFALLCQMKLQEVA